MCGGLDMSDGHLKKFIKLKKESLEEDPLFGLKIKVRSLELKLFRSNRNLATLNTATILKSDDKSIKETSYY